MSEPSSSTPLFESAFAHAGIGMALVGLDGQWLRVNRALCDIVGYPEEELLALTFQEITHPDDLEADLAEVDRLLAGKVVSYQMEKRYFRKGGGIVWVLLTVSLVRDAAGAPLHFISQIQDTTAQKLAQATAEGLAQELQAQTELMETILEASSDHVYLHDRDGRYLYASGSGLRALGLSREVVIGRTWMELGFPESSMRKFQNECDEVFRTGSPISSSLEFPLADGAHFYEYVLSPVFDREGRVKSVMSAARDATVRRNAERAAGEQIVTKRFARRMFSAFSELLGPRSEPLRRKLGRSMAADAEGPTIAAKLTAFQAAGLGALSLDQEGKDRFVFSGHRMLDLGQRGAMPSCHLALGFTEGVVERITGLPALGTEVTCEAQGAPACRFVVMARATTADGRPAPTPQA